MKFDEEMEQAAKKIQDKYRKKQNDRQKLPQVEIKKPVLEPKKQIPGFF